MTKAKRPSEKALRKDIVATGAGDEPVGPLAVTLRQRLVPVQGRHADHAIGATL